MDLFHLPESTVSNQQVFWPTGNVNVSGYAVWNKPPGCSILHFLCIGPGGGGGGGRGGGVTCGGGGGGSSGCISSLIIPEIYVPQTLYIIVSSGGTGGAGGSAADGTNGAAVGNTTSIMIYVANPATASNNVFLLANRGNFGTAGTSAAAGGGGAAPAVSTDAVNPFAIFGNSFYLAGVAGTNGGAQTGGAGVDQTMGTASMIFGGTGGGGAATGVTGAGGGFPAISNTPFLAWAGGQTDKNGNDAFKHFGIFYGGCGGGGDILTSGGNGGKGGMIPGVGGGGGAGSTAGAGGNGGSGGPGMVMITAFS